MSEEIIRLTRAQVREVDRRAISDYNIPSIVLMENAARGVFDVLHGFTFNHPKIPFVIVCGGGNNGGDGLAVARHLHNAGQDVQIYLTTAPDKYTGDAATNFRIVQKMNLPLAPFDVTEFQAIGQCIVVDAIFGTGLTQAPRDSFYEIATNINESSNIVVAVDLPSGLDCDTGRPLGPACIRAKRTVTFVAEKAGFAHISARPYIGRVTIADIGCPKEIIPQVLHDIPA